jgi:ankyrin repeat protein
MKNMKVILRLVICFATVFAISGWQSVYAGKSSFDKKLNAHLFDAVNKGDLSQIKRLIDSGANPNARNEYDETPLMVAVLKKTSYACCNIMDLLVLNGANVNLKRRGTGSSSGCSALIYAANDGRTDCVQSLLDHGASIDVENMYGETALISAVHNHHFETVKLLISRGASLGVTKTGIFPLLMASIRGPIETVELLINKGANINVKFKGRNLLELVKSEGQKDKDKIIKLLRQKGAVE